MTDDKPDKPKIILNISIGGMPLERVTFKFPLLCPNCGKQIAEKDILCPACWMVIEKS